MTLNLTHLSLILIVCALSSCQSYEPSAFREAFEIPGSYRSISECAASALDTGTWRMTPLETEQMVRFVSQRADIPVHRIDVSWNGEDGTKVEIYLTQGGGAESSLDTIRIAFHNCSAQLAAIVPLSKDPG